MRHLKLSSIFFSMAVMGSVPMMAGTLDKYQFYSPDPNYSATQISYVDLYFTGANRMKGVSIEDIDGITLTFTSLNGKINHVYRVAEWECENSPLVEMRFDYEEAAVKERMTLLEPGSYHLNVPAGSFKDNVSGDLNPAIETTFTIVPSDTHYVDIDLDLKPGEVADLSHITVDFPNKTDYRDFFESKTHWSQISLVRKGEDAQKYNCSSIAMDSENYTVSLTFSDSPINTPGEYLLTIPSQVFGGAKLIEDITYGVTNNAYQCLYTIPEAKPEPEPDLGVMGTYTLDPAAGEVSSINSVKITFPQTGWDGIQMDAINQVTLTKDKGVEGKEEVFRVSRTEGANMMQYCTMYFNYASSESSETIEITAPGTYTLSIPAKTFHYDDWTVSDPDQYLYNGNIEVTYIIAADNSNPISQATITPASGTTIESISEITLSFDTDEEINAGTSADWEKITLKQADETGFGGADAYFCVNAAVEGSVVTLRFAAQGTGTPVTILKKGEYSLNIPAGIFSLAGNPDITNDGMTAIYAIPYPTGTDELLEYELSPSSREVEEITVFRIQFPNAVNGLVYPGKVDQVTLTYTPFATDENAAPSSKVMDMNGYSMLGNVVTLDYYKLNGDPLTEAGIYTLTIPAGTFQAKGNPNSVNSEITMTYEVSTLGGVCSVEISEVAGDVYGIDGRLILRNATQDQVKALPSGLYIISGRKICVK